MGIEYEKELYSRMESLRSDLEAEYEKNIMLAAEVERLQKEATLFDLKVWVERLNSKADNELREAVTKAEYWETYAEELHECMDDAVEIGDINLREAVEILHDVRNTQSLCASGRVRNRINSFLAKMEKKDG